MQFELLEAGDDAVAMAARLRALVPAPESIRDAAEAIVERVRAQGDEAVLELTQRYDTQGTTPMALRVGAAELHAASRSLADDVRAGLELAVENVGAVARAALGAERELTVERGSHQVRLRSAPVRRAAIYVPGGRAPYPSTVVMGAVTASVAGVEQVVVASPPGAGREIDAVILAACELTGVDTVLRMGGAQAIAALAYGTDSVAPVDVIVGPGNLYVQEAKRLVFGRVGIDGFAGPSDLVIVADSQADPGPLALDLLAQAEHGPGSLVVAVSTDPAVLRALGEGVAAAPDTGAAVRLVQVARLDHALELAQELAPEHLQLVGAHAEGLAPEVTRAGCVFVGQAAGTAFGDYVAGSNHVLPTGGAARFASGLSPAHFRRSFSEVRIEDADKLARAAAPVARAEGFEWHARSMEARIGENIPT